MQPHSNASTGLNQASSSQQPRTMSIASVMDANTSSPLTTPTTTMPTSNIQNPSSSIHSSISQTPSPTSPTVPSVTVVIDDDLEDRKIKRVRKKEETLPPLTGLIYQCDACNRQPLQGCRFRCKQCAEFDLCEDCMLKASEKHDPSHTFERFVIEEISSQKSPVSKVASLTSNAQSSSNVLSGNAMEALITSSSRPPRRSASSKSVGENSIEKMDEVLTRCHVGPLPASQLSSTVATQFLELYEAGILAMEQFKKGKAQEQITARIAMALVGIPLRARRGGNFIPRTVHHPLEQETVSGVMASLTAQLLVLDVEKIFTQITPKQPGDLGDIMDLERLSANVTKGIYFRKVESPEHALSSFQRHVFKIWSNPQTPKMEEVAPKFDKLCKQAIDEIRDGLGLAGIFGDDVNGKDDEESIQRKTRNLSSQKAISSSSANLASSNGKKDKDRSKKRSRDKDEVSETGSTIVNQSLPSTESPVPPQSQLTSSFPAANTANIIGATTASSNYSASSSFNSRSANNNDPDLRAVIKRLREDLDDAHSRIDVLVHILREKVANPLIRGLDRAGR